MTMLRALCQRRSAASLLRNFSSASKSDASPAALLHDRSLAALLDIYKKLSKAKLSAFVVFSTATGFILSSKEEIEWRKLGVTVLGTFGASASANAFNQIYEREKDAAMSRTRLRPLPIGRVTVRHAIGFAAVVGVTGVTLLHHYTNDMTAALAAANVVLYTCIYTPLKQMTPWNTWIGAIVGAVPPVIGWTAARGTVDPGALVLFGLLYFWQIPHFLALAWTHKADYARAGYHMLSRFDPTGKQVAACAFRNCIYLLPLGILSGHLGMTSGWFGMESAALTTIFALAAAAFVQMPSKQCSRSLFRHSLYYLPLQLCALLLHRQPPSHHLTWTDLHTFLHSITHFRPEKRQVEDVTSSVPLPHALFAPFPFMPVPQAQTPSWYYWEGLEAIIRDVDEGDGGG